ncbi:phytanoyl-CoA dioxygenase family protein [Streptomyces sp. DSM 44915]|uniref:Phytanoyl-CoA dioxygenase family protein n=1 Tax=Streptomyces chisholmiae TaxID=3075540 RepID=A0ABU2JRK0_9ACTN|nr:phytanoyl-CoA dioxygenase family protein [Streptomyces sp. DSM 44915]MDT0266858.1 phytanoyl-CoA dioxygenase family protein [Streptomyces sp. DSM 44915]
MTNATLSERQIEDFVRDGFVRVEAAFPRAVAEAGQAELWRMAGVDPDDPASWTQPVIRITSSVAAPFRQAANTGRLRGAFDQLVGAGRWLPRLGLGTFPIRFPHRDPAGDDGWHLDASFAGGPDGTEPRINLRSRGRALLLLFLFTDVGEADAPTRIKVGSHRDVPPFLAEAGEDGREFFELCRAMDEAGRLDAPDRPLALATGRAGDVYLCHPFLVHAAQPHRGSRPRIIAQPPLEPVAPLQLARADGGYSPVEAAVRLGLGLAG